MSIVDILMPEKVTDIYTLLIRRYLKPTPQEEEDDVLA